MSILEESLAWTGVPVPATLKGLAPLEQQAIADYTTAVVKEKTDGLAELYQAIGMIVKYIPHFIVIPLMVEHIRPQIAAGVCRTMGVEQAVHYANDLPVEYFSEVSKHLDDVLMAQIFEQMKRHHAEKVINHELRHHLSHMLGIAAHLEGRMLEYVSRQVTLPDRSEELQQHPHREIIEKLRAMQ
ncbi:MAG: hypothetical protein HGB04_02200 [Chlorobiaceae bacterium]|nr:hypothetical protein [Chlorobiaceae bacterium]